MKFKDTLEGDVVLMTLSGKIMGGEETTLFRGKIYEYLDLNKKGFVIDLNKVEWSNSAGIGMLVAGYVSAKKAGGRMVLANITNIKNLLAMTRLLQVFECYDSVNEAKEALAELQKRQEPYLNWAGKAGRFMNRGSSSYGFSLCA